MKILFLVPYPPGCSPSQRFRFEQYFGVLISAGYTIRLQSFLTVGGWHAIYKSKKHVRKFLFVTLGFIRRLIIFPKVISADLVFIHREVTPVGPPVFEFIIARIFRKKIIYDFDDAIWTTDNTKEGRLEKLLRWRSKTASICKMSYKISCGNDFLCDYAKRFNTNVALNPTTIDTSYHQPRKKKSSETVTIGWTGSHSTLKYLDIILPAFTRLKARFPTIDFLVIAESSPSIAAESMRFVRWNEATEIDDLSAVDIGVMPLPDDVWAKGKCGFKALQYMALEIPAVVSPVGVNTKIVKDGVDGFVAETTAEWEDAIVKLITDEKLRSEMGKAGRRKVMECYSVSSNTSNFLALFERSPIMTSPTR